jgi:hypothetical protein
MVQMNIANAGIDIGSALFGFLSIYSLIVLLQESTDTATAAAEDPPRPHR